MKILKTAILGQGRSGRDIHAVSLQHLSDKFEIAAIVEPLEKRRGRAKQEYGCAVYADYVRQSAPRYTCRRRGKLR